MKVHFLDVEDPDLKEGSDLVANCGALIKKAAFAMKFDFDLGDIVDWNRTLVCETCLELEPDNRSIRFIYGLVSGKDVRS